MAGMKGMTPIKLAEVCEGIYFGPEEAGQQEITCLLTDNREIKPGGMFVAIKGERVDANRFIPAAYEAGALCCMSENAPEEQDDSAIQNHAYIQVKSCLQALKDMATYYRMQCQALVIGITGSVGKTTTKEMLASVLSQRYNVLKTQGNFNNEIGVPLTLFRLREEHEIAIVEMGISDFGEMSRLTAIAKPNLCVITNIGPCHLENLGDLDGVLRAKTEIFQGLSKKDHADFYSEVFLNGEDEKLRSIQEVNGKSPVFFGIRHQNENPLNAVYPSRMESRGLAGTDVEIIARQEDNFLTIQAHVPMPGMHMVTNALAAAAIGRELHLRPEEIAQGIEAFRPVEGHGSILETERFTIMNDCYNANPASMKAGLDILSEVEERKVAILGDMFELGAEEEKLHYEIGAYAVEQGIDLLIFIGTLAKQYHLGAESRLSDVDKSPEMHYFANMEEVGEALPDLLKAGDAILVKASHGMHFEKIVASITNLSET